MKSNFDYLKNVDPEIYGIISAAEKLYKDEYYSQCIIQTRLYGENIAKNILGTRRTTENTYDEILSTLSDILKEEEDREFLDDLYFLKTEGNREAHARKPTKDGITALECLKRAFEAGIVYSSKKGKNKKAYALEFSIDKLMEAECQKTVVQKYKEEKNKKEAENSKKKKKEIKNDDKKEQKEKIPEQKEKSGGNLDFILSFIFTLILFLFISGIIIFILPDIRG